MGDYYHAVQKLKRLHVVEGRVSEAGESLSPKRRIIVLPLNYMSPINTKADNLFAEEQNTSGHSSPKKNKFAIIKGKNTSDSGVGSGNISGSGSVNCNGSGGGNGNTNGSGSVQSLKNYY